VTRRGRLAAPLATERGLALVAVLVTLALLLAVAGELAQAMRIEGRATAGFRHAAVTAQLAEAGYHRAVAELLPDVLAHELDPEGRLAMRRTRLGTVEAPARSGLTLGRGQLGYRITDESARLNVNRATPDVLRRLLVGLGVERANQDVIVDSLLDWRDSNEEHRLNGAESEHYLALPLPYRSKNANLDDVAELAQVRGVTADLLHGRAGSPGLLDVLTVAGAGAINVNTVSAPVLAALGFATAEIQVLAGGRPYLDAAAVPGPLRRGAQQTRTDTFRIEAWGETGGRRGRTLVAVVQRRVEQGGGLRVVPLSWRWTTEPAP
jgi:general secretion pathway protein K